MTGVGERLEGVRSRIDAAAMRSGRDAGEVRLVGATKGAAVPLIEEAVRAGLTDLGENRAQDLEEKAGSLSADVRWHFLGPLQTNKVRYLDDVDLIHALSRAREAAALQARAERTGRGFQVLVEVNVAGEPSKHGAAPDELDGLLAEIGKYPLVTPRGVMIVAPQVENHEDVRWVFSEARRLRDRFATDEFRELSMGMSDDFEVAIEEGATIVRIGRAIFY